VNAPTSPAPRSRRLVALAALVALPVVAGCTVATNQPDDYDATTEANVLDAYVRQGMDDPGDAPIIYVIEEGSEEGQVYIPDDVDPATLDAAQCVYDGISDEEDGIPFDTWKSLDSALADDPQAVADSAADTEGEPSDVDEAFLQLQEIEAGCRTPG
jgi:hypothetical protein